MIKNSWQSFILTIILKIFFKRLAAKLASETSPEKLYAMIRQLRKAIAKYAPIPPPDAKITSILIEGLPAKWVQSRKHHAFDTTILYFHGGGYTVGSSTSHLDFGYRLAKACHAGVLLIDYRLTPEHALHEALEDAVKAYQWLCQTGIHPATIVLAGDSAGGGLVLSTLVKLRDSCYPLPKKAVCLSPWTDLALRGDSVITNRAADPYIVLPERFLTFGDSNLLHPLISPLYADLSHLPPLYIQVGSTEVLLDDSRRLAEKARQAQVSVTLEIWDNMPHCWQLFAKYLPEGKQAIHAIADFIHSSC